MKRFKRSSKTMIGVAVLLASLLTFTACGRKEASQGGETGSVKKVNIGVRIDLYPTSYVDTSGELKGYDIDVIKKIDELLPEYEFTYDPVAQEPLLLGLDSGQYAAAVAGFFWNATRAEKYLFPENNIGGTIIGLVVRKEDADRLVDLEDIYETGSRLAPFSSQGGTYGIAIQYNQDHPDKQVEIQATEWRSEGEGYLWVADKRYDAAIALKSTWDKIGADLGLDSLIFNKPFTAIKTWSLFGQGQEELMAAYDRALAQLKAEGVLSELSLKWYNEDVPALLD